jgi:hypothetical protein
MQARLKAHSLILLCWDIGRVVDVSLGRYYAVAVVVALSLSLSLTVVIVLVLGAGENRLEASTLTTHESSREMSRHIQLETSRE